MIWDMEDTPPPFKKAGMQIPGAWHSALKSLADSLGLDDRDVILAAIDMVLTMKRDAVKKRARELRDLAVDDFHRLESLHASKAASDRKSG